ncbi:MAG: DUF3467 domain-containing protein [Anaerolineales bacterium]|nr:DUF3467 domain-containing protein [Anaerolineales bacterium]
MTEIKGHPTPPKRPQIILPNDMEPSYANLVRIAHTPSEVMLDFARMLPGEPGARIVSRVLVSPISAKLLIRALTENLAKYEAQFGEIQIPQVQSLADFLFRPPNKDSESDEEE